MSQGSKQGPLPKKWAKYATPVVGAAIVAAGWFGLQGDDGADGNSGNDGAASGVSSNDADTCAVDTLPPEAKKQIDDILQGAPPDDGEADGKHFGNYEGLLPKEKGSYYREYTVRTPGINHRGERRIVVGGGTETDPEVWYYTSDHFESFCSIPDAED
ncbi:ribonuclease domain-containing protein [Corynebacterium sp. YSMAA1_1_F7]|uniref:ribonuclease domain-containing protein n=1 Tax=Corynebacterium sp. YSMAA1_1_F7 TaxID=3383590 RepID=UPI0038D1052E